jgi:uncharacterized protein GlcG (DUF336 family)
MSDTVAHRKLTHDGALKLIQGGIAKAKEMGVPQCIAVVDDGGNMLAFVRMDGGKFLSATSALNKARTAASTRQPTGGGPADIEIKLALATQGGFTNLKGGLPVIIDGHCVGAIGVGSGTGDQDAEVGRAALAALGAQAV